MGYIFDAMKRAEVSEPKPEAGGELTEAQIEAEIASVLQRGPAPRSLVEAAVATAANERPQPTANPQPAGDFAAPEVDARPQLSEPRLEPQVDLPITPTLKRRDNELDERLVAAMDPGSLMAEEYRSIRTALLARCGQKRNLVHTITSATPQEGKTITSLNLGLSFAELRNRTAVVVEADLRLPTFAKLLHLPACKGVVHFLRGEASLDEIIHTVPGTRLTVLPAGERCNAEAIQLLTGAKAAELLRELKARFDHVIVDTPPVTELADAGILGAMSDEVLMVVRMGLTPRPLVEQAARTLHGYGAPVAGVIATDQRRSKHKYYNYRYGYRYRYQSAARAA